jgi:hypothetical protein
VSGFYCGEQFVLLVCFDGLFKTSHIVLNFPF